MKQVIDMLDDVINEINGDKLLIEDQKNDLIIEIENLQEKIEEMYLEGIENE